MWIYIYYFLFLIRDKQTKIFLTATNLKTNVFIKGNQKKSTMQKDFFSYFFNLLVVCIYMYYVNKKQHMKK